MNIKHWGEALTIGEVIDHLKADSDNIAYRSGWNGKGQYIELQRPTQLSKMTLPYIFIKTVRGDLVPWFASQTDILAEDWVVGRVEPDDN